MATPVSSPAVKSVLQHFRGQAQEEEQQSDVTEADQTMDVADPEAVEQGPNSTEMESEEEDDDEVVIKARPPKASPVQAEPAEPEQMQRECSPMAQSPPAPQAAAPEEMAPAPAPAPAADAKSVVDWVDQKLATLQCHGAAQELQCAPAEIAGKVAAAADKFVELSSTFMGLQAKLLFFGRVEEATENGSSDLGVAALKSARAELEGVQLDGATLMDQLRWEASKLEQELDRLQELKASYLTNLNQLESGREAQGKHRGLNQALLQQHQQNQELTSTVETGRAQAEALAAQCAALKEQAAQVGLSLLEETKWHQSLRSYGELCEWYKGLAGLQGGLEGLHLEHPGPVTGQQDQIVFELAPVQDGGRDRVVMEFDLSEPVSLLSVAVLTESLVKWEDLRTHAIMINDWSFFLREFKLRRTNHHRIRAEVEGTDARYELCWDNDKRFRALIGSEQAEIEVDRDFPQLHAEIQVKIGGLEKSFELSSEQVHECGGSGIAAMISTIENA